MKRASAGRRKYLILPRKETLEQKARRFYGKTLHELVAEAAYYRAEMRGFFGGNPDRDWADAEAEIERLLSKGGKP